MEFVLETPDYHITAAEPRHLEELPRIELAAAVRFRGYDVPATLFADTTPLPVFAEAQSSGRLWVALDPGGKCVGFALVEPSGARLHLAELDVLPDHGRRGVGSALVREVERWGDAHGFSEVTLTTYRDVAWNGPLYRRLGYELVPPEARDAELTARLENEAARGLDSLPRVAMRKALGRPAMRSIHRFTEPRAFLARAESFLRAEEAENVLMLGICGSAHFDESCYLATVEEDRAVVACALRTPPHSALLTRADRRALELLANDLADKYRDLPAIAGPEPTAGVFAGLWSALTGAATGPAVRMRVFEASRVIRPSMPAGALRAATEADLHVAARWAAAFIEEAGLDDPSDPQDVARERIGEGSLFLWEDARPVSMAAWAGRTGRTVRINFVYTPPEHRGHGYASACVASLTQQLLDEGFSRCCLYTDLANPTSNKIYQAIGYRPVCDAAEYPFRPAGMQFDERGAP